LPARDRVQTEAAEFLGVLSEPVRQHFRRIAAAIVDGGGNIRLGTLVGLFGISRIRKGAHRILVGKIPGCDALPSHQVQPLDGSEPQFDIGGKVIVPLFRPVIIRRKIRIQVPGIVITVGGSEGVGTPVLVPGDIYV